MDLFELARKRLVVAWIGIALLAVSWIFSLKYFYQFHWAIWVAMACIGSLCMRTDEVEEIHDCKIAIAALVLFIPSLFFAPWPYRIVPLLFILGLLLRMLPVQWEETYRFSTGFLISGTILLAQAVTFQLYKNLTGRSHELPGPFPRILEIITRLLGMDVALEGSNLSIFSMRKLHTIGLTWELLVDPVSLAFLIGGLVFIILLCSCRHPKPDSKLFLRNIVTFLAIFILWLPLKVGLMISIYVHRVLLTGYEKPLHLISQFWNPWIYVALLVVPVLFAIGFVAIGINREGSPAGNEKALPDPTRNTLLYGVLLFLVGCLTITLAFYWNPQGTRKAGRILVDEYHSQAPWIGKSFDTTRTDKPFDTEWYGHASGYNYACIYDYCSRFYDMSRLFARIDEKVLRNIDVLFLKVPSTSYSDDEVAAVRRFVKQGGGLLLMGEHTNVFGSGVYLNQIAATFGFKFRYDCLFGIDSVFKQKYYPPLIPHPIIRNMESLDFAVSCSIDPGMSSGRAVMLSTGLKNLGADYHASNFYPQAVDQPEMRYGAFIQLWETLYGRGRVAAFTDSTIFANFSSFEFGKSELMLGMLEWLNHQNSIFQKRGFIAIIGILFCIAGLIITPLKKETWIIILAAGMCGWVVAGLSINSFGLELPKPKRPMVRIAVERGISSGQLPVNGFISGQKDCFGQFERSILRLGYFFFRTTPGQTFDGDLLIFLYPNKKPKPKFIKQLDDYVLSGGKVLILDSPENSLSTANDLLGPFGFTVKQRDNLKGSLTVPPDIPNIDVPAALEVTGGNTIASLAGYPVAATIEKGKGSVTVIGFGSRFSDANMGIIGDIIPNDTLRKVFDFEFTLLKGIIESKAPLFH